MCNTALAERYFFLFYFAMVSAYVFRHSGERSHSGERHRGHASPISYKQSEYSEGKSGQKRKELKSKVFAGSRIDR